MKDFKVGDKVRFEEERNAYTVRACDERYLVCTKPFSAQHTVTYTIVDLQKRIRGKLIFCRRFITDEDCQEVLQIIQSGNNWINPRKRVELKFKIK